MLARLSIRDIVLIERLDIDYAAGLAVLTGETRAGKSILLDDFALALGIRGAASLGRDAEEAVTTHRARVEQARREADWLRHAVEELTRLKPETGEESALAEKRAAMMAVDKVAEDLRDAYEAVAGERSPIAALSAAL